MPDNLIDENVTYSADIQAAHAKKLGLFKNATLTIGNGLITLTEKNEVVFQCGAKDLSVTTSGINGAVTLSSPEDNWKITFYERSHYFKSRSWHNQMMYKKHDDFIRAVNALGVKNLPPSSSMPNNLVENN